MASQQLSVHSRLQPYIPRLTQEWLVTEPERNHRCVEGSLVFADISGFTKLSEKLAKLGKVGAEEMADAITDLLHRPADRRLRARTAASSSSVATPC